MLAFASFIWLAAEGYGLFGGLMIAFSVFYMVADAYKTAEAQTVWIAGARSVWIGEFVRRNTCARWSGRSRSAKKFPAGALVLIAVGGLFLLRTLSVWRPDFDRFWPVILIVIGAVLLVCRIPWKKSSE